ncbi:immunity 22 family protein [Cohnella hashimotonis]|uniref:Immunity 22 family protein n=1 Tax=Cohnella hashimotonis TaxID=2826895 RepID=A0ABT6TNB5_9BACL|nr:immunity 22 family protein [Cohnella hashimotonis]MDI4648031.1 immunity 22 family protein [Cohnella hashimotonis]
MPSMHVWVGYFESEEEFEKFVDQEKYLEAWAIYDNEPPTGGEEDAEPSPALRCEFCKEVELDTYDEDYIELQYYGKSVDADRIVDAIVADREELGRLWNRHRLDRVNALIAYEDKDLSTESASKSIRTTYLGKVNRNTPNHEIGGAVVHYLWVGESETLSIHSSEAVRKEIKKLNIDEDAIVNIHFYYSNKKEKLDEMIIMQVEDFNVAESMILKVDELQVSPTANAILDLIVYEPFKIDGSAIGSALGMAYIGKFDAE